MVMIKGDSVCIREVWADNLEEEFELIREVVDQYPYVAMDTEFPGVAIRPLGRFNSRAEHHYHTLKANVDTLKLIQLGLTFSDEEGNLPDCGTGQLCVWQFNLREFNPGEDIHAPDSIELLRQSGIDFKKNNHLGIDSKHFAELLMSSGVVLNENMRWITFHSAYDFGVAELLKVERTGICHQAGSDSLLTSSVFMKLKEGFFKRSMDKHTNVLYGLGLDNCY
ncbi:hypothetical protein KI387_044142 [Taxus chinensis]|uniref:poly(A)-specific ribonuclease n=1 Tax=Taxus chinensis TaxID=29808 RepID=A0AA38C1R0_TAXCH|nr:hypothetical protein KI387_044142 [Taxus chinensis]